MRRISGEQSRITVRLPLSERRDAERQARLSRASLSDFVRQAVREKVSRDRRGLADDGRGLSAAGDE